MSELFPNLSEKIQRWTFNGRFGRNFATMFDLQMWCFGCDIRREQGNLLVEYGFVRDRPEGQISGSSHYAKRIDAEHTVHLWGFAVVITSSRYALCLKRFGLNPRLAEASQISENIWRPHELPPFYFPKTEQQIKQARQLLTVIASELNNY